MTQEIGKIEDGHAYCGPDVIQRYIAAVLTAEDGCEMGIGVAELDESKETVVYASVGPKAFGFNVEKARNFVTAGTLAAMLVPGEDDSDLGKAVSGVREVLARIDAGADFAKIAEDVAAGTPPPAPEPVPEAAPAPKPAVDDLPYSKPPSSPMLAYGGLDAPARFLMDLMKASIVTEVGQEPTVQIGAARKVDGSLVVYARVAEGQAYGFSLADAKILIESGIKANTIADALRTPPEETIDKTIRALQQIVSVIESGVDLDSINLTNGEGKA